MAAFAATLAAAALFERRTSGASGLTLLMSLFAPLLFADGLNKDLTTGMLPFRLSLPESSAWRYWREYLGSLLLCLAMVYFGGLITQAGELKDFPAIALLAMFVLHAAVFYSGVAFPWGCGGVLGGLVVAMLAFSVNGFLAIIKQLRAGGLDWTWLAWADKGAWKNPYAINTDEVLPPLLLLSILLAAGGWQLWERRCLGARAWRLITLQLTVLVLFPLLFGGGVVLALEISLRCSDARLLKEPEVAAEIARQRNRVFSSEYRDGIKTLRKLLDEKEFIEAANFSKGLNTSFDKLGDASGELHRLWWLQQELLIFSDRPSDPRLLPLLEEVRGRLRRVTGHYPKLEVYLPLHYCDGRTHGVLNSYGLRYADTQRLIRDLPVLRLAECDPIAALKKSRNASRVEEEIRWKLFLVIVAPQFLDDWMEYLRTGVPARARNEEVWQITPRQSGKFSYQLKNETHLGIHNKRELILCLEK